MRVQYRFKSQRREQTLTGLDIVTGRNGTGKTALLQAIQYGLLGRVPGVGQRSLGVLDPDGPSVVLAWDGCAMARSLVGGKQVLEVTGGGRTLAENERRVSELTGAAPLVLDFASFAAESGPEQRRKLLALAGGALGESEIREACGEHWEHVRVLWEGDPELFLTKVRRFVHDFRLGAQRSLEALEAQAGPAPTDRTASDLRQGLDVAMQGWHAYQRELGRVRERQRLAAQIAVVPEAPRPGEITELEALERAAVQEEHDIRAMLPPLPDTLRLQGVAAGRCPVAPVPCPRDWSAEVVATGEVKRRHEVLSKLLEETAAKMAALRENLHRARAVRARWDAWYTAAKEIGTLSEPDPEPTEEPTELSAAYHARLAWEQEQARTEAARAHLKEAYELEAAVGEKSELSNRVLEYGLGGLQRSIEHWLSRLGMPATLQLAPLAIVRDHGPVAWEACSTGERILVSLAVGLALLQSTQPHLRVVLIDNAESLDAERLHGLLVGLGDARLMGVVHYAVLAGVGMEDVGPVAVSAGWVTTTL